MDLATTGAKQPTRPIIRIVTALIAEGESRLLLVRKRGTTAFMQPGGKLLDSEAPLAALDRELREELECSIKTGSAEFLGDFTAVAANEPDCVLHALLYRVELDGIIRASAEIEEAIWFDVRNPTDVELAPFTRQDVLPLVIRR